MKKTLLILIPLCLLIPFAFQMMGEDPASKFIDSLSPEQRSKVVLDFEDQRKLDWHFFPSTMFSREGIPLDELSSPQLEKLEELMLTFLSKSGYEKVEKIKGLEDVLRAISGDSVMRDSGKYFTTFYGDPKNDPVWAMSFEGHHISLNFTVVDGEVSSTPRFLGANPAMIPEGPRKGDRTLQEEEDLGFDLINSFTEAQKQKAIFQEESFKDIVSFNIPKVDPFEPAGIPYSELDADQQKKLMRLIDEYLNTMPKKSAMERRDKIMEEDLSDIYFGWVGAFKLGSAHYYRIQGKTFLIEFDNSQNNANHIHTVWRDFDGDFGRDLIHEHLQSSPHHH
ncbi:MAG: DUF3500 domain-containing protein [Algoriphagus sp.]|uniref:DUF3500 domain-containing protein n=1 Tax=Algoriphagus sp. TaxID=1872435 RepID=UPI00262FC7B8|nr:DUF3500 domain-containing protein [Algoriphagus sp.]MDG1279148.1 DUF3500 domain-containing protein [Algoriphagus sp.]